MTRVSLILVVIRSSAVVEKKEVRLCRVPDVRNGDYLYAGVRGEPRSMVARHPKSRSRSSFAGPFSGRIWGHGALRDPLWPFTDRRFVTATENLLGMGISTWGDQDNSSNMTFCQPRRMFTRVQEPISGRRHCLQPACECACTEQAGNKDACTVLDAITS